MKKPSLDREGFPFEKDTDGFAYRITRCCGAAASCDEFGTVYCKGCYKEVDSRIGDSPKLKGGAK